MIDIKLIRENPDLVRENIRKKFQNSKLKLVDEIINLDIKWRKSKKDVDDLRSERNRVSEEINKLMKSGKKSDADDLIVKAKTIPKKIDKINKITKKLATEIREIMMKNSKHYA